MLEPVKIRILHPWQRYMPGDVITPGGGVRQILIQRGIAELVIDTEPGSELDAPETAMVEPQVETAVKRRGRPRTREYVDGKPVRKRKKVSVDVG